MTTLLTNRRFHVYTKVGVTTLPLSTPFLHLYTKVDMSTPASTTLFFYLNTKVGVSIPFLTTPLFMYIEKWECRIRLNHAFLHLYIKVDVSLFYVYWKVGVFRSLLIYASGRVNSSLKHAFFLFWIQKSACRFLC